MHLPEIERINFLIKKVVVVIYYENADEVVVVFPQEDAKVVLIDAEVITLDLVKKEVH